MRQRAIGCNTPKHDPATLAETRRMLASSGPAATEPLAPMKGPALPATACNCLLHMACGSPHRRNHLLPVPGVPASTAPHRAGHRYRAHAARRAACTLVSGRDARQHHWRSLHLIELAALATLQAFPLPPSDKDKSFEPLDFVRILALVPALLLISIVLSLGGLYWWTDAPWLGWALAAAVLLLAAAIINEGDRSKPLLYLEWMGSAGILRFAAVAGIAATTRRTGTSAGAGKQSLSRGLLVLPGAGGCTARPAVGRPLARAGEPEHDSQFVPGTRSRLDRIGGTISDPQNRSPAARWSADRKSVV